MSEQTPTPIPTFEEAVRSIYKDYTALAINHSFDPDDSHQTDEAPHDGSIALADEEEYAFPRVPVYEPFAPEEETEEINENVNKLRETALDWGRLNENYEMFKKENIDLEGISFYKYELPDDNLMLEAGKLQYTPLPDEAKHHLGYLFLGTSHSNWELRVNFTFGGGVYINLRFKNPESRESNLLFDHSEEFSSVANLDERHFVLVRGLLNRINASIDKDLK